MRAPKRARTDWRLDQLPARQQRVSPSQPASQNQAGMAQRLGGNQNLLRVLNGSSAMGNSWQFEHEAEQASRSRSRPLRLSAVPSRHGAHGNEALSPNPGDSLDGKTQKQMEAGFQTDFSGVRVHHEQQAAELSEQLQARAFTFGQDIYFGRGEYRPDTAQGGGLLAHELAHTVQQRSGEKVVQMQDKGSATTQPSITAQAVFGMPQGSKVLVGRTMKDFIFNMLASKVPMVGSAMRAIDQQIATVTTATDDTVTIVLDKSVTLPAAGNSPAVTYENVTLSLTRSAEGLFDFGISATTSSAGAQPLAYQDAGLTARPEGGAYTLSAGAEPHLRVTPASGPSGAAMIEAYTGPYLKDQSATVRALAPARVDLLSLTRLPDAPSGSPDQQKAAKQAVSDIESRRAGPREDVFVGGGFAHSSRYHALLTGSWTYRFRVSSKTGNLLQIPLEAEVMYAPSSSVVGALTTGAYASLSDLHVPVNIRFVAGIGGGSLEGPETAPGVRPNVGVLGPILGAGLGYEHNWFRVDIRYEHLLNLVHQGPAVDLAALRVGAAF